MCLVALCDVGRWQSHGALVVHVHSRGGRHQAALLEQYLEPHHIARAMARRDRLGVACPRGHGVLLDAGHRDCLTVEFHDVACDRLAIALVVGVVRVAPGFNRWFVVAARFSDVVRQAVVLGADQIL